MKKGLIFGAVLFFVAMLFASFAMAQSSTLSEPSVCCEKTNSGLFCQNVPENQCAAGSQKSPTSCESTSFCKIGTCYSGIEGTCVDSPQVVCNAKNATWAPVPPAQCNLGCCVLGDQAAFVSLVRCKRLSSFLGIPINYKKNIETESECILSVKNNDKGACVYEFEFEKTCKFTTREECSENGVNGTGKGTFFVDKLCTARELGTVCSPTTNTACLPGKEEVYFLDSCGNSANIYDATKKDDLNYWNNIVSPEQSCGPDSSNAASKSCGNCNYLKGSICRAAGSNNRPTLGNSICANLNCVDSKGNPRRHGESWCVNDDSGKRDIGKSAVGSRYFKHVCENGEEVVEACADFRQEECIQDKLVAPDGYEFSQAACRVNRWQDCINQVDKDACENTDRRDCTWRVGFVPGAQSAGVCIPKNPAGLKFWEGEETKKICAVGDSKCEAVFEVSLTGGAKCVQNCECLTQEWINSRAQMCNGLGDCGPNINWENSPGRIDAMTVARSGYESEKYPTKPTA